MRMRTDNEDVGGKLGGRMAVETEEVDGNRKRESGERKDKRTKGQKDKRAKSQRLNA